MAENKQICAFDVGIKNMSYCILQGNQIVRWDLINLLSPSKICECLSKTGKKCSKSAKYTENDHNYCELHSKTAQNKVKMHKIPIDKSLYSIGTALYDVLETIPEIINSDRIVIENQPTLINPTMKSISMLLFSFFVMKKHKHVSFVSPSSKLEIDKCLTKDILGKCEKNAKYKMTKRIGILYCMELLNKFQDCEHYKTMITTSKKKDDLCDSFLHAYYNNYGSHEFPREIIDGLAK